MVKKAIEDAAGRGGGRCVDRMKTKGPRRRSRCQSRRRRRRIATAFTRAPPWTSRNNCSLSGYCKCLAYVVVREERLSR